MTAGTIVTLLPDRQFSKLLLAFVTIVLILLPELIERLFHCHLSQPFYLLCLFYAIGPMLGHSLNLYHLIPWWDRMLHAMGGIVFAIFGGYLYSHLGGDSKTGFSAAVLPFAFP